jgi:hypothetical protein
MIEDQIDETMQRLLDYHKRRYWLENGWSIRCRVWTVAKTEGRPLGIKYSFSLHDFDGSRIYALDNAHGVPRQTEFDHSHRFRNITKRDPYSFVDGDTLLADFFSAVRRWGERENVQINVDEEDSMDAKDLEMMENDDAED